MGHLGARVAQWDRLLDLTTRTSLSPIRRGFAPGFVNYKKGCFRLAAASDKVYQLLAHGRWFSPGTPASSTTKTGRHDIVEILLKVALKHQRSMKSIIMGHLSSVVHEHFIFHIKNYCPRPIGSISTKLHKCHLGVLVDPDNFCSYLRHVENNICTMIRA